MVHCQSSGSVVHSVLDTLLHLPGIVALEVVLSPPPISSLVPLNALML